MSDNLKDVLREAKNAGATLDQLAKIAEVYSKKKDSSESQSTGGEEVTSTASTPSDEKEPVVAPTFLTDKDIIKSVQEGDKAPRKLVEGAISDEERQEIYDYSGVPEELRPDRGDGYSIVLESMSLSEAAKARKANQKLKEYDDLFVPKTISYAAGGYGTIQTSTPAPAESSRLTEDELNLRKETAVKEAKDALGIPEEVAVDFEQLKETSQNAYDYHRFNLAEISLEKAKERERVERTSIAEGFAKKIYEPVVKEIGANAAILAFDALGNAEAAEFLELEKNTRRTQRNIAVGLDPEDTRGITETLEDGDEALAAYKVLTSGSESLGLMAAVVMNPEVGLATMAASSGLETYSGFRDRLDLSAEDKATLAVSAGAVEVLMGQALGGLANVRRFRKAAGIADDIGNASLSARREAYNKAINYLSPYSKKVKSAMSNPAVRTAGRIAYDTGGEAVEEFAVELTNQVLAHAIAGEDFNAYALADAAILGGGMGAGMASVTSAKTYGIESHFYNKPLRADLESYQELQTMYADLKQAAREETDPAKRKIILEEAASVREEGQQLIKKANEAYDSLSFEERSNLHNINKRLSKAIDEVKNADNDIVKRRKKDRLAGMLIQKAELETKAGIGLQLEEDVVGGLNEIDAKATVESGAARTEVEGTPLFSAIDMINDLKAKREKRLQEAKDRVKDEKSTVEKALNTRVTYLNPATNETIEGVVTKDGQRLAVETEEGIVDIGLYENFKDRTLESLTMQPARGFLNVNADGTFSYNNVASKSANTAGRGEKMYNLNGVKAIKRNRDGSVRNVLLTNEDGSVTFNLKGEEAEEAAYQILLKNTQTPEDIAKVDAELAQDAEDSALLQQESQQAAGGRKAVSGERKTAPEETKTEQPKALGERIEGADRISDEARLVLSKYMLAISHVSPNHNVIVHESVEDVKAAWVNAGGNPDGNPIGFNDPNTDTIHVHKGLFNNVQRGDNIDVVRHEFVHPILNALFTKSAGARADLARGVLDILNAIPHTNAAKRAVFNHARKSADNDTYTLELLTEFFNLFSKDANLEEALKAEPTLMGRIINFINKFLSRFTSFRINSKTPSSEVKSILEQINKSFSEGLPITMEGLAKSHDTQLQAFQNEVSRDEVKKLSEIGIPANNFDDVGGIQAIATFFKDYPVLIAETQEEISNLKSFGYRHLEGDYYGVPSFDKFSDADLIDKSQFVDIKSVPNPERFNGLVTAAASLGVDVKFLDSSVIGASSGYLLPNSSNGLKDPAVFINLDEFNEADTFFGIGSFIVETLRSADNVKGKMGGAYLTQMQNAVDVTKQKMENGLELDQIEKDMYLPIIKEMSIAEVSFGIGSQGDISSEQSKKSSTAFAYALSKVLGETLLEFEKDMTNILEADDITLDIIEEFNEAINNAAMVSGQSRNFRVSSAASSSPKDILNAVFVDRILDGVEFSDDVRNEIVESYKQTQTSTGRSFLDRYNQVEIGYYDSMKAFSQNVRYSEIPTFIKINEIDQKIKDGLIDKLKQKDSISLLYIKKDQNGSPVGYTEEYPITDFEFNAKEPLFKEALSMTESYVNMANEAYQASGLPIMAGYVEGHAKRLYRLIKSSEGVLAARSEEMKKLMEIEHQRAAAEFIKELRYFDNTSIFKNITGGSNIDEINDVIDNKKFGSDPAKNNMISFLNRYKRYIASQRGIEDLSGFFSELRNVDSGEPFYFSNLLDSEKEGVKAEYVDNGGLIEVLFTLADGTKVQSESIQELIVTNDRSISKNKFWRKIDEQDSDGLDFDDFFIRLGQPGSRNRLASILGGLSIKAPALVSRPNSRDYISAVGENDLLSNRSDDSQRILEEYVGDYVNNVMTSEEIEDILKSLNKQNEYNKRRAVEDLLAYYLNRKQPYQIYELYIKNGGDPSLSVAEGSEKALMEIYDEYAKTKTKDDDITFDDVMSKYAKGEINKDVFLGKVTGETSFEVELPDAPDGHKRQEYSVSIGSNGYIEFKNYEFTYADIPDKWGAGKIAQPKILDWLNKSIRFFPDVVSLNFSPVPSRPSSSWLPDTLRQRGRDQDYIDKYGYSEEEVKRFESGNSTNFKRRTIYNMWAAASFGNTIGIANNPSIIVSSQMFTNANGETPNFILSRDRAVYETLGMDSKSARQASKLTTDVFRDKGGSSSFADMTKINDKLLDKGFEPIPELTKDSAKSLIDLFKVTDVKKEQIESDPIGALNRHLVGSSILELNADSIGLNYILKPSTNVDGSLSIPKISKLKSNDLQAYMDGKVDGSDIVEALEELRENEAKAFQEVNNKKRIFSWDRLTNMWVNRNQNLRDAVRKGMSAYVKSLLTRRNGYVMYADRMFKRYDKKIFGGLTMGQETIVDDIIFLRRVIQVDKNFDARKERLTRELSVLESDLMNADKADKSDISKKITAKQKELAAAERPAHPAPYSLEKIGGKINLEEATKGLAELRKRLGDKEFDKLNNRANSYFEAQKEILAYAKDIGLIDEDTYNRFSSDDYSPRIFLEKMFGDASEAAFKGTNLSKEFIQSIKDGSNGDIFSDARTMLSMSLRSIRSKDIQNQIMRAMHNDARKKNFTNIDFIKEFNKETKRGLTKVMPASKGFVNVFYRVDGKLEGFQIKAEMKDALFNNVKDYVDVPSFVSKALRRLTGTSILKAFATGTNTAFALTSAMRYVPESVIGRGVYDKYRILPVMAAAATLDIIRSTGDALFNPSLVEEYLEAGGETLWLSAAGKPKMAYKRKQMSTVKAGATKFAAAGFEGISWAANKSELAARLALYKRSKSNIQKANPNMPMEQVKSLAVEEAIMLADFATSGAASKPVDLVSAYFNAGIQGFRGAASYARSNPKKFMEKLSQFFVSSFVTQLVTMLQMDDDEWDRIPDYQKMMYMHVYIGRDEEGNPKTLKLPRAHSFLPVSSLSTVAAQHVVDIIRGKDVDSYKDTKAQDLADDGAYMFDSLIKSVPVPGLPVVANAYMVFHYNIDPWKGEEVFKGGGNKEMLEYIKGQQDTKVRDFYKYMTLLGHDAGMYDVSPKKLQVAVEKFITNDKNFLVDKIYDIADALAVHGGKLEKLQAKHGIDTPELEKAKKDDLEALFGVKGRIYTVPSKKYEEDYSVRKARMDKNTKMYTMKQNIKDSAKEAAKNTKILKEVPKDVIEKVNSMTENPFERKALVQYWKYYYRGKLVDNEIVDLMFSDNAEERVAKLESIVGDLKEMDAAEYTEILKQLKIAGMTSDKEFLLLVAKKRGKK